MARHDEILQEAIERQGGHVFKTVGDAFCAAFTAAADALEAALGAQRALFDEDWGKTGPLRVRIALHTGAAEERRGDYFGPSVNRVARLLSAGHGGQVLLSLATQELVRDELPTGTVLRDLGERRLKDLFRPERVFQLTSPDLPSSFPPLKTLDARLNNLPTQATPLIGREREVADICEVLRGKDVRLLTLTGPGGTGKTRLGLQAAAELLDEFGDGVFFVPLATITDPDLVIPAISRALDTRETGERSPEEVLKDYLQDKEVLLLLDNFEQVIEAAPLVGELLAACPTLKVLTTSRSTLRVYGEREFTVPSLKVPDPKRLPPVERLTQYEAVRLFVERARETKAGFTVTDENALAVAEICARLDGLPLAIELAATRIKLLPPQAMLTRLNNRLKLLRGGACNLPARQQTLRGTIEWSHDLLEDSEKILFARLAVFSGGSTLEAIEAVCDLGEDFPVDVLDGLSSLLDKSLLRQHEELEGEPRFVMLETIHEYAREKLQENAEAEDIKRAHAAFFLALAEEAEPEFLGPQQGLWVRRLEVEHDNLRGALSWLLASREGELGLRLGGALWRFWYTRGYLSEAIRWLEQALSGSDRRPIPERVKALEGMGWLTQEQGDTGRAEATYEEMLELSRKLGDRGNTATALNSLGTLAAARGDNERARALLDENMAVLKELEGEETIVTMLNRYHVLNLLGFLALHEEGDPARATVLWGEGLALARRVGDPDRFGLSLTILGFAALLEGDPERARALCEEALASSREEASGVRTFISEAFVNLGLAVLAQGEHERARASFKEALVIAQEVGIKASIMNALEGMASLAGAEGDPTRAVHLWGAAQASREVTNIVLSPVERTLHEPYLAVARSRLGEARWEEALAEGRIMSLDEAAEYACSQ